MNETTDANAGTTLITGASRGLGLALAGEFAGEGRRLIITARDAPPLEEAADALRRRLPAGTGPRAVTAIAGDVADPAHRAALAKATADAGGIGLLVNNASTLGTVPLPRLADQPLDDLERAFAINTLAPLALIQALLPGLRERRGAVLNITSDAAIEGYPGWGGYGATKAALEQLSNVLAAEEPEIAVWWVDPGEMRTRMLRDAGEDADAAPPPEHAAALLKRLVTDRPPSGRLRAADLEDRR
ncbi:SDR family NAD(P)-dependent oxidoreductase [Actinomadura sp. SCN-SB]|uniref:SDR family NAD(P)-dependent oxidoreductase n=1 Tax=Actinomadura sp. SCN-SB TaxID=3373092 RepID=UPI0037501D3B